MTPLIFECSFHILTDSANIIVCNSGTLRRLRLHTGDVSKQSSVRQLHGRSSNKANDGNVPISPLSKATTIKKRVLKSNVLFVALSFVAMNAVATKFA